MPLSPRSVIAITEVEPKRTVVAQDAPHFREHLAHAAYIAFAARFFPACPGEAIMQVFQTDLPRYIIVAQPKVRRAHDAALDASLWHLPLDFYTIALHARVLARSV
jgi:hypothetical protein